MSLQRASVQVSLASIFVYLISFVNQLLIARTFGAGVRMDAYLAGSNVPLIVNNLIGAVFVYAVVPHIVHASADEASLKPKITGLLVGCLGLSVVTLAIGLTAHFLPLLHSQQFGGYQAEAAWSAALSWGSCAVFFVTALSDALFNAGKKFLFPVLAYFPAYLLTSVACFALGGRYGGPVLAGATLVGYLLVVPIRIYLQRGLFGAPFDFSLFIGFLRQIPFTALAVLSLYAFPVVDTVLGPTIGDGILSILGYSTRIISTLAVIVALGPFGVLIPELAEHSAAANRERFAARSLTLFRYALTLLVPVAIWITVFRLPVITVLLERGEFGRTASSNLANLLAYNVPGSIFMVLSMLVIRVFLADKRIIEASVLSGLNLLLYFGLSSVLASKFGLAGFGIAFASAWTLHAIAALVVLLRKDSGYVDFGKLAGFAGRLAAAAFATGLVALLIRGTVPVPDKLTMVLVLAVSFAFCLFVYFGIGELINSPEHQRVWRLFSKLIRRSRSA